MWVKNSREKDISFFRPLYHTYSESFDILDKHLAKAFHESSINPSSNQDLKFLALHTLYQSSKSNLFPQSLYHTIQPSVLRILQSLARSYTYSTRFATPMDCLRVFSAYLRCEEFAKERKSTSV